MRKKRVDAVDDGRVIAPMNIEGMPWHTPKRNTGLSNGNVAGSAADSAAGSSAPPLPEKMTRRENLAFAMGVLKAVLLVTFVFIGFYFAFILFCVNVWFR